MNNWHEQRLKHRVSVNPRPPSLPDEMEVSFVPMEAVGELGGLVLEQSRRAAEVRQGYTGFVDGDIVLAKITPCFENGKGAIAIGLLNGAAFGTTELHVMRPAASVDRRWLFYLTLSHRFRKLGEAEMYGAGGQKRVPPSYLANYCAAFPSLAEQRAIADVLDKKTAAIDALIAKKERLIELLQEKRQALITQAVTKGLDPNVPMKDSGIEWLGSIPSHWAVKRLKHVLSHVVDCPHSTPEYDEDGPYYVVRTADVSPGLLNLDTARRATRDVYLDRVRRLKPIDGDILYSREGERFGMAALVPPHAELCLGQRMMHFRVSRQSDASFVMWALNAEAAYQQVKQDTVGATSPRVNIPTIANLWLAVPPASEQARISETLTKSTGHLDQVCGTISRHVERVREYRQALISAAVTGKLDVNKDRAA